MVPAPFPAVLTPPPRHISHRGGSGLHPENTLTAFGRAVEDWRTDMVELDVHRSRDGRAVVIHDPTVDRTTDGSGAVAEMTAAGLGRLDAGFRFTRDAGRTFPFRGCGVRIPLLDEVLDALPDVRVNIEIKPHDPALVEEVVRSVEDAGATRRVQVGSARAATHRLVARTAPDLPRYFCDDDVRAFLVRGVLLGPLGRYRPPDPVQRSVEPPHRHRGVPIVSRRLVRTAHRLGLQVHVWTVDDERLMHRLLDRGVDGILSDRPDVLDRVLRVRGLR
jgi:glycerophosphoryl diester phosphodiesterase